MKIPRSFKEKMLPTQQYLREKFFGDDDELIASMYSTIMNTCNIYNSYEDFKIETYPGISMEEVASSPMQQRFLKTLVLLKKPKNALEIGTFIGTSSLYIASAMPSDGKLVTIEKYDKFADIARKNFAMNGLDNKIQLIVGDAFEELPRLSTKYDFVFLDGDKGRYESYYELLDDKINSAGLFVIDDVFFHGDALNTLPETEKGLGVKRFLEKVTEEKGYNKMLFPIGDGIMLMIKK